MTQGCYSNYHLQIYQIYPGVVYDIAQDEQEREEKEGGKKSERWTKNEEKEKKTEKQTQISQ